MKGNHVILFFLVSFILIEFETRDKFYSNVNPASIYIAQFLYEKCVT